MQIPNISNYKEENRKWNDSGNPLRTPERINELFQICSQCPHFVKLPLITTGQCSICSCFIKQHSNTLNKLAWATTECPDSPKRWEAESAEYIVQYIEDNTPVDKNEKTTTEAVVEETKQENQLGVPNRPKKDCGCR